MSSKVRIDLTIPTTAATYTAKTRPINGGPAAPESIQRIASYFEAISGGSYAGRINETIGAVQATGTVTFSSTGPTNTETMTIANVTITAVSGTPSGNQIKTNASATVVATELAALVNSSSSFAGIVSATSSAGVVTLTSLAPGNVGNGLELSAGTFANTVVAGFSGGSEVSRWRFSVGQA